MHLLSSLILNVEAPRDNDLHLMVCVIVDEGSAWLEVEEACREGFGGISAARTILDTTSDGQGVHPYLFEMSPKKAFSLPINGSVEANSVDALA
jgi:hypothetical protein